MSEVIAHRKTYSGVPVELVQEKRGCLFYGPTRSIGMTYLPTWAAFVVADDVSIFELDELHDAIKRAAAAARKPGADAVSVRRALRGEATPKRRSGSGRSARMRMPTESLADHVRRGCRRIHCPVCG